jgi:hypothetical protein
MPSIVIIIPEININEGIILFVDNETMFGKNVRTIPVANMIIPGRIDDFVLNTILLSKFSRTCSIEL